MSVDVFQRALSYFLQFIELNFLFSKIYEPKHFRCHS